MRAKVMVGLLEFTLEAYQHGSDGTFHMCDITLMKVGHTFKYDVMISELAEILSDRELTALLSGMACKKDKDCTYTSQCSTVCDTQKGQCTTDIYRPNLFHVCKIMEEYVLPGVPAKISKELNLLLGRCAQLSLTNSTRTQVEHSLILNELKSILWKEISY